MDTHSPLSSPALPESTGPPSTSPPPAELEELNEAQLREMYENEEIARFLYLFSRYVDEVKDRGAPDAPRTSTPSVDHRGEETCDDNDPGVQTTPQGPSSDKTHISKEVAYKLLLPCLPAPRASYQEFTLNRLRLAVQRIYPATVPYYLPIINRLDRLARWENPKESSAFCAGFWLLWWHDLLAAAFFFNLLLVLLKHRLFPYPSLAELKRHREEVSRGNQLGEQLSQRISAASDPRMRDVWRYAKLLIFPPKGKKTPLKENESHPPPTNPLPREPSDELESTIDSEEVQELKRLVLFLMNEITDFHERIKNLFIWRKPASSWLYCCILVLLVIGALLVPTKYIVKAASGTAGFLYWHVTPVIIALPPKDRLRLPVPLLNVPTDTQYAMELISQRVAAGEEITPSNFTRSRLSQAAPSPSAELSEGGSPRPKHQFNVKSNQPKNTPEGWKRVGSAIGSSKTLLQEGKRLLSNVQMNEPGASSTDVGSSSSTAPASAPNTHTFPAQHSSSPGLITFTLTTLYFTPLTALRPTLIIAVPSIKGVKKKGILKGMNILWTEVDPEGHRTEKLDKFTWIGSRDELFARIVGANTNIR